MRVVVLGATGNVGTAVVRALLADDGVDEIVGVARRRPGPTWSEHPALTWATADISTDRLDVLDGADVVVHLAWKIQPSHDEPAMRRTNVDGTQRLLEQVVASGVPRLVYASSVGTYAPGPKEPAVDESWPATGVPTSTYSRHKAAVETMLDEFEREHPSIDVVRMRTSLVFQRRAASEVHRLFLGRLAPWHVPRLLRIVPDRPALTAQATHADDVADAYRRAVTTAVRGAFNIAADPPLTGRLLAGATGGRALPIPTSLLRAGAALTYHLRLQPAEAGWLDMATQTPLMDSSRARAELGWSPERSSIDAVCELLDGIGDGAGDDTVPLQPRRSS